jgi:hypothetical protein
MNNAVCLHQTCPILSYLAPIILVGFLVVATIIIVPYWQIFKKAGFPAALAFLMVIPLVNLIMLYVLAFSQWKTQPPQQG